MPGRSSTLDPLHKFRFQVQIEGVGHAGFATAVLPKEKTTVSEYREGTDSTTPRLSPAMTKYDPIVLTRGRYRSGDGDDLSIINWRNQVKHAASGGANDDPNFRRAVTIKVVGRDGTPALTYELINAWPSELDHGELDAKSDDHLVESITLVYEGFKLNGVLQAPAEGESNAAALGVS